MMRGTFSSKNALVFTLIAAAASFACADTTFYWSMESDTPDIYPAGTDNTPEYSYETHLSTDEARSGNMSLSVGDGSWGNVVIDNPTNNDIWTTVDEGSISLWFKYSETFSNAMLMQLTGKAQKTNPELDTNDGMSLRFKDQGRLKFGAGWAGEESWGTTYMYYYMDGGFQPGQWYHVVATWDRNLAEDNMVVGINGNFQSATRYLGQTECEAWHQILIGNDLSSTPSGLYIDDFAIGNTFIPEPASISLLLVGGIALIRRRK